MSGTTYWLAQWQDALLSFLGAPMDGWWLRPASEDQSDQSTAFHPFGFLLGTFLLRFGAVFPNVQRPKPPPHPWISRIEGH